MRDFEFKLLKLFIIFSQISHVGLYHCSDDECRCAPAAGALHGPRASLLPSAQRGAERWAGAGKCQPWQCFSWRSGLKAISLDQQLNSPLLKGGFQSSLDLSLILLS